MFNDLSILFHVDVSLFDVGLLKCVLPSADIRRRKHRGTPAGRDWVSMAFPRAITAFCLIRTLKLFQGKAVIVIANPKSKANRPACENLPASWALRKSRCFSFIWSIRNMWRRPGGSKRFQRLKRVSPVRVILACP
jgi:hypothetical protein